MLLVRFVPPYLTRAGGCNCGRRLTARHAGSHTFSNVTQYACVAPSVGTFHLEEKR